MSELQRIDVSQFELLDDERRSSPLSQATTSEADPSVNLERKEAHEIISQSIKGLPERLKLTLWLYYYEQLSMKEVGSLLGVNEAGASQLHSKAIAALRSAVLARLHLPRSAAEDKLKPLARTIAAL